jgi:hypothetical protein
VLDMRLAGSELILQTEGAAGTEYLLHLRRGSSRSERVRFEGTGDPVDGYVKREIRLPVP